MAEFSDVGAHCHQEDCKMRDFLPYVCNVCKNKFCGDHRLHGCVEVKDVQVPVCPMCDAPVELRHPGQSVDEAVDAHISSGKCGVKKPVVRCAYRRCKEKSLFLVCGACKLSVCVAHRMDHGCKGNQVDMMKRPGVVGIQSDAQKAAKMRIKVY